MRNRPAVFPTTNLLYSQEKYETLQRDNEKLRLEIEETKTNHIRSNESLAPSSGLGSEDDEQENTAREFCFLEYCT